MHHPQNAQITNKTDAQETKCKRSVRNVWICWKTEAIALEIELPFFGAVNKLINIDNPVCIAAHHIYIYIYMYGLADFRLDASRVTLPESRQKHTCWRHGVESLSVSLPLFADDPPVSGGFPKQNSSNEKNYFIIRRNKLTNCPYVGN